MIGRRTAVLGRSQDKVMVVELVPTLFRFVILGGFSDNNAEKVKAEWFVNLVPGEFKSE